MRNAILATLTLSGLTFAGETYEPAPAPAPAPEPSLWNWFIGGSYGYLIDSEEDMYHAHIGVDFPSEGSWGSALFLEIGYTDTDGYGSVIDPTVPTALFTAPLLTELDVMPLSLNYKMEWELTTGLNLYLGGGLGVAFVDFDTAAFFAGGITSYSSDDEVLMGQIFAGLVYNVTEFFEIYGGARWIWMDDADHLIPGGYNTVDFGDDVLIEGGIRFNF